MECFGSMETVKVGESHPFITVIVTAHKRTRFLITCLQSVINQSLDRSKYEIILVKNSKDELINEFAGNNNIRVLDTDLESLGKKIVLAMEESGGEVLCFLEDDDVFEPGKLEYVYTRFASDVTLCYFHNSLKDVLDASGNKITRKENSLSFRFYITTSWEPDNVMGIYRFSPDWNNSCISVRKSVIAPHAKIISELNVGQIDSMLYYLSLISDYNLLIEAVPLTSYRMNADSATKNIGDFRSYRALFYKDFLCANRSFNYVMDIKNPPRSQLIGSFLLNVIRINLFMLNEQANAAISFWQIMSFMRLSLKFGLRFHFSLSIIALAQRLHNGLGPKLFFFARQVNFNFRTRESH
jgi:glycosyltransferase involved in cell wall biosynthesis